MIIKVVESALPEEPPTISLEDVLDVVRRRLLLILGIAAAGMVVAALVIFRLPDVFEARSVVYIEPARMPESYRRPGLLAPKLSQLVGILRQELLSRETLRGVVNDLELYKDRAGDSAPEGFVDRLFFVDPVERARKDIQIDIVKRFNEDFVEISVRARAADLAARAVNKIADILASKNRRIRLSQEREAKGFIETQLVQAQDRLQEAEGALTRFREQNQEAFPENETALLDRMSKLRSEVADRREGIVRANRNIAEINGRIAALMSGSAPAAPDSERAALEKDLRKLEDAEADLVARGYGPAWPELVKVRSAIERTRKQIAEAAGPQPPAASRPAPASGGASVAAASEADRIRADLKSRNAPPEIYQRVEGLLAEIAVENRTVESLERDLEAHARELARLDLVSGSLATTRAALKKLQAAAEEASAEHKGLLNDLHDVEKLIAAEEAGRTDQFRTIEAAEAPLLPAGPKRGVYLALALAASLGAGFGVAYLVDSRRRGYRTFAEVEADLGLPVLATLPLLPEPEPSGPGGAVEEKPAGAPPPSPGAPLEARGQCSAP
jgi:uncharacterized protein involved in exopolysaccharide biosynthesis